MAMTGKTYVDGKDIYAGYGVYITSGGWNGLVAMPPLKTPESNDWQEEDGVEVDLTAPVLDTREVTVTFACAPDASRMADFIALLSDGAYHTFRCDWIGRTYRLRMVSQSKLSYNPALGTFSLKMADDFPLSGYTYKSPSSSMPVHDDYLLDGTPMTDYGVRVLSGTLSNVLSMPNVKTALLRNVSVLAGAEYDPETVTFKSKDVKVQCLMRAGTLEGLWRNWDALLYDLVRAGERTLFCADAGRAFPCFYKSCSVSAFDPERLWIQFALTLTFTYDTRMDYVLFRISPTPSDAKVTINGVDVTFVLVSPGTSVSWSVSKDGYVSQSGSQTVNSGTTVSVSLSKETYVVTFRVSPADSKVTVNGTAYTPVNGEVTVNAEWGDVLEWSVSRDGYGTRSGSLTVKGNSTVEVELIDAGSIITGISYDDIPAGGGTVTPRMDAIEGCTLIYSGTGVNAVTGAVSADSLGTEARARTRVTTVTVTATYGGTSVSASCEVYQQENRVERTDTVSETYGSVQVTEFFYEDASAGGGSVFPTLAYSQAVTGTYTDTYTSGATDTRSGSSTITSGASVSYSAGSSTTGQIGTQSLGTTLKERTLIATVTVTVTLNGSTATATAEVYQEANEIVSTSDEDTYSDVAITGGFAYDDIGAGGGSVTPTAVTYTQTHTTGHSETYTSGEVKSDGTTETLTTGASVTYSGTGVNTSTGAVSADSLGTTVKSRTKITTATATVTMNGKSASKTADVYQAENKVESESSETTYGTPSVSLSYAKDIPAGGGSVSPTLSYSQTHTTGHSETYTSGEVKSDGTTETITSGASVSYSGTGVNTSSGSVSADSLGTTVKDRTKITTATATVTMNGKSASKSADVYQEANKETMTEEMTGEHLELGTFEYDDIPAAGGTVYPTVEVLYVLETIDVWSYTSGAQTREDTHQYRTPVTPDGLIFADNSLKLSPITLDTATGAATASAATSTERQSLTTVTAAAAYTSPETGASLSATATAKVWQEARETYLTVTPTTATVDALGGTVAVTVSSSSDWTATSNASWLSVSAARENVNIDVSSNSTTSKRTGRVTFTNADGLTATVTVTQEGYAGPSTHTLTINLQTDVSASLALTVDGARDGTFSINGSTPYVGEFAHGAVVGWTITPFIAVGGTEYQSASGEVTMTSDQTLNVALRTTAT